LVFQFNSLFFYLFYLRFCFVLLGFISFMFTRICLEEAVPWPGSGRERVLEVAEKLADACSTNACSTVQERRFSAA